MSAPSAAKPVEIVRVDSARQRRAFVRMPWPIYASDPHWVPPLLMERAEFINPRKHPFYRHGAAALYLARRGGENVGRIMVSDDPHFNAEQRTNLGSFGLFDSIDDQAVASALLDAAATWLRERGRTLMIGPNDYSTNYASGLLVDGFDTPPRLMMNHNPPYYQRLFENWGLTKTKDLYAWWFEPNDELQKWGERVERLAARSGVTIRHLHENDVAGEIRRCRTVYHDAWKQNWGFVPMTDAEFEYFGSQLARFAKAELLLIAELDGLPVGFSLTLPDLNEASRDLNGRLFRFGLPLGYFRLKRNLERVRTARLFALGVTAAFRRRGIAELLILRTLECGRDKFHFTGAELSWTLEDNHMINRTIEAVGGKRYKTYRMYEKSLLPQ